MVAQYDKQYEERTARRKAAVQASDDLARQKDERVARLRAQQKDNQRAIRFGAAREAAAQRRGGAAGGGAIAAAADVGMSAEARGIEQAQQDQRLVDEAIEAATGQRIQSAEYAATQGTEESDYAEALAEGTTEAEQAIQDSQGFFNDDEDAAARKIRAMISRVAVKNPRAARELEAKYADRLDTGLFSNPSGWLKSWWD